MRIAEYLLEEFSGWGAVCGVVSGVIWDGGQLWLPTAAMGWLPITEDFRGQTEWAMLV